MNTKHANTTHVQDASASAHNALYINLFTGGGKFEPLISGIHLQVRHWWLLGLLMLLFLSLAGCSDKPAKTILGVPVQGTPWELAAAIEKRGVQETPYFYPECVLQYGYEQASIEGWYCSDAFPIEVNAELICDLDSTGQVINAVIFVGDEVVEECKENETDN